MKILAFESSAKSASVCIVEDEKILTSSFQNMANTHSKTLLCMYEDILDQTGITLDDIDLVAVANGPGSYTGIRIGVSVVQGLSLAQNKDCIGVSTLEALAYNVLGMTDRDIISIMDARAGQVYAAIFSQDNDELVRETKDLAVKTEELVNILKNFKKSYILVGDGAKIWYNYLKENDIDVLLAKESVLYGNASSVAFCAMKYESYKADKLVPTYLRASQAEREKNGK